MSAELNVQLRLLLDQVQGDAQKAAEIVKKAIGGALPGSAGSKSPSPAQIINSHPDVIAAKVANKISLDGTKTRSQAQISINKIAQQAELATVKKINAEKLNAARVLTEEARKEKIDIQSGIMVEKFQDWKNRYRGPLPPVLSKMDDAKMRDKESFYKNMSMLAGPVFAPGSPLSTAFAARQVFSALRTEKGKGLLSQMGLGTGIGGAVGGTAALVGAATALGLAFKALQSAVDGASSAIKRAGGFYGKAVTSGFGMGGTVGRNVYAGVLGVSEDEIMRFGTAVNYLNPRLKYAVDTLQKTAMPLASLNMDFKVLQENLAAMFAQIAMDAAPALSQFANALSAVVNVVTEFLKNPIIRGIVSGLSYAAMGGLGALTGIKASSGLPSPNPYMKQLPASAWERMGLVLGGVGGTNYAQQTAQNTSKMAKLLEGIARIHINTFVPLPSPSNP